MEFNQGNDLKQYFKNNIQSITEHMGTKGDNLCILSLLKIPLVSFILLTIMQIMRSGYQGGHQM